MNASQIAKALGRRGGRARARKLSSEQRKKIASAGGQTRWLSQKAARRMADNFVYVEVVQGLRKPLRVKSVSRCLDSLPRIHEK